jgi:hypothetical protein
VTLDPLDVLVLLDARANMDVMLRMVSVDLLDSLVLVVLRGVLELTDKTAVMVTVVMLDALDPLERMALLEVVALLAELETVVSRASMVKLDLVELVEVTVLAVRKESTVTKVMSETPVPRVTWEVLDMTVSTALMAATEPPELLDSTDLMASRVCLDSRVTACLEAWAVLV